MTLDPQAELYQQVILEHNKKPRNFKELPNATHKAEGYNPLCGDHLTVYLHVNDKRSSMTFLSSAMAVPFPKLPPQ